MVTIVAFLSFLQVMPGLQEFCRSPAYYHVNLSQLVLMQNWNTSSYRTLLSLLEKRSVGLGELWVSVEICFSLLTNYFLLHWRRHAARLSWEDLTPWCRLPDKVALAPTTPVLQWGNTCSRSVLLWHFAGKTEGHCQLEGTEHTAHH